MNAIHDKSLVALRLVLCETSIHDTKNLGQGDEVTCRTCKKVNALLKSNSAT